jgi:SpoIIAA-like
VQTIAAAEHIKGRHHAKVADQGASPSSEPEIAGQKDRGAMRGCCCTEHGYSFSVAGKPNSRTWSVGEQRRSHERYRHNEDNGRFADYFIHLLLGIKLRDAPVGSTISTQRI